MQEISWELPATTLPSATYNVMRAEAKFSAAQQRILALTVGVRLVWPFMRGCVAAPNVSGISIHCLNSRGPWSSEHLNQAFGAAAGAVEAFTVALHLRAIL